MHWRFVCGVRLVSHEGLVGELAKAVVLLHPNEQKRSPGTPVRTVPTSQNRDMGHPNRSCSMSCCRWKILIYDIIAGIEGTIGIEGFAGAFFEKNFVVAKETVGFVASVDGDKENLAFAFAPDAQKILRGEEDGWGVGEGAAEEH